MSIIFILIIKLILKWHTLVFFFFVLLLQKGLFHLCFSLTKLTELDKMPRSHDCPLLSRKIPTPLMILMLISAFYKNFKQHAHVIEQNLILYKNKTKSV